MGALRRQPVIFTFNGRTLMRCTLAISLFVTMFAALSCKTDTETATQELQATSGTPAKYNCGFKGNFKNPIAGSEESYAAADKYITEHPVWLIYLTPTGATIEVENDGTCKYKGDARNAAFADNLCKGIFKKSLIRVSVGFSTGASTGQVEMSNIFGNSDVNGWLSCKIAR